MIFSIRGAKGFESEVQLDLRRITVLLGPNNGGKSSLLRLLAAFTESIHGSSKSSESPGLLYGGDTLALTGEGWSLGSPRELLSRHDATKGCVECGFSFDWRILEGYRKCVALLNDLAASMSAKGAGECDSRLLSLSREIIESNDEAGWGIKLYFRGARSLHAECIALSAPNGELVSFFGTMDFLRWARSNRRAEFGDFYAKAVRELAVLCSNEFERLSGLLKESATVVNQDPLVESSEEPDATSPSDLPTPPETGSSKGLAPKNEEDQAVVEDLQRQIIDAKGQLRSAEEREKSLRRRIEAFWKTRMRGDVQTGWISYDPGMYCWSPVAPLAEWENPGLSASDPTWLKRLWEEDQLLGAMTVSCRAVLKDARANQPTQSQSRKAPSVTRNLFCTATAHHLGLLPTVLNDQITIESLAGADESYYSSSALIMAVHDRIERIEHKQVRESFASWFFFALTDRVTNMFGQLPHIISGVLSQEHLSRFSLTVANVHLASVLRGLMDSTSSNSVRRGISRMEKSLESAVSTGQLPRSDVWMAASMASSTWDDMKQGFVGLSDLLKGKELCKARPCNIRLDPWLRFREERNLVARFLSSNREVTDSRDRLELGIGVALLANPDRAAETALAWMVRRLQGTPRVGTYLPPLREVPSRVGSVNEAKLWRDFARAALEERSNKGESKGPVAGRIDKWLGEKGLGLGLRVDWKRSARKGPLGITILTPRFMTGSAENSAIQESHALQDCGFGVSQVVPFVIALIKQRHRIEDRRPSGDPSVLVEQPELHLHPSVQHRLAGLVVSAVEGWHPVPRFVVCESHSEHFIRGLQQAVGNGHLDCNSLSLNWVDCTSSNTDEAGVRLPAVVRVPVDELGRFTVPWPKGFFPTPLSEVVDTKSMDPLEGREDADIFGVQL